MEVAEKHHSGRIQAIWNGSKAPLVLLVIITGFYWRITLTDQYTWLDGPDLANQVVPWFQFQATEWHRGHVPLWDPYLWGGQSLIGQAQPGVAYPLNWLLFSLPLRNGFLRLSYLHWYFVLIHFQGALFCYWLCRDLKRSHLASLLAGLAFSLGGWLGTTDWPQMMNGAVWAPLVFLYFLRAMRGERPLFSAAASGASLGIAFLGGHHQVPIFTGLAIGGCWLYYLFREGRPRLDVLRLAAVFGVFTALLGAVQMLPAFEYGSMALRWVSAKSPVGWKQPVPYYVHQDFAFYMTSLPGIVLAGVHRHANPFMGVVAVWLATFAVAAGARDRLVRLFAAVAVGGLLFSFGHNSVFHGVIYSLVPMVEKARNSSFAIFVFCFGLSVLTAHGIDSFRSEVRPPLERRSLWTLTGFSVLILLLLLVLTLLHVNFDDRLGIAVPAALLLSAVIRLRANEAISPRAASLWMLGLVLLELGNVSGYVFRHREEENSFIQRLPQHADIAAFLREQKGPVRVEVNDQEIPYNFGDWYGIDHFGGYLASMTANVAEVQGLAKPRQMYGINFRVAKTPTSPDQQAVFEGQSGIKVFRVEGGLPRVWVVHAAEHVTDPRLTPARVDSPQFDPRRTVLLERAPPALESCEGGTAELTRRDTQRLAADAELPCRGMVIFGETWAPGWRATVDGKLAEIYEANGFLRGVVVDAGRHRIDMVYRPVSVYAGAALTALGVLLLGLLRWTAPEVCGSSETVV